MRNNFDAKLVVSQALPAPSVTNYSPSIDLGQAGDHIEGLEVVISVPATPTLLDGKTVVLAIQDSGDNAIWADLDTFLVVQASGGLGGLASEKRARLATTARRYIRLRQAVATAGGDVTAVSGKLRLAL